MAEDKSPVEVRLFKQTLAEASICRGSPCFSLDLPRLDLIGMVFAAESSDVKSLPYAIDAINEKLAEKARAIGATHIFGVEYQIATLGDSRERVQALVYGDAYKPKPQQ